MAFSDREYRFSIRISVAGRCPQCGRHYIQKIDDKTAECRRCGAWNRIEMNDPEGFKMLVKEIEEKLTDTEAHQEPRVVSASGETAPEAAREAVAEAVQEAVAEAAQEAVPEAVQEVVPEAVQEAVQEVVPEAARKLSSSFEDELKALEEELALD